MVPSSITDRLKSHYRCTDIYGMAGRSLDPTSFLGSTISAPPSHTRSSDPAYLVCERDSRVVATISHSLINLFPLGIDLILQDFDSMN